MTVRHEEFASIRATSTLAKTEGFIAIEGNRVHLHRNPFLVETREVKPYSLSLHLYVFDPRYDSLAVESASVRMNGLDLALATQPQQERPVAFEEAWDIETFKEKYPTVTARYATWSATLDSELSYDPETILQISLDVLVSDRQGHEECARVTANAVPRREESSGSWFQCLRLIAGRGR
jgi:hypothetical protein